MRGRYARTGRTVTPYLSAIPWRVSVGDTVCFTRLSVRVMCLAVLPYFFRVLPVSRMHRRSSISLAPFLSIIRPPGRSRETGTHHNSSTYVSVIHSHEFHITCLRISRIRMDFSLWLSRSSARLSLDASSRKTRIVSLDLELFSRTQKREDETAR